MKYQLEKEQYEHFGIVPPDELPTPAEKLTQFNGLQYVTMLDRYSLRDNSLETLKIGDTVVTTVKPHPKYPTQGYGTVIDIDLDEITLRVAYPEYAADDNGEPINLELFKTSKKSTFKPLETYWEQIVYRNAKAMAGQEKTEELKDKWFKEFYWMLRKYYIPAGRILYGAGSGVDVTLFNCFVLPFVGDSRTKIIKHIGDSTEIMARGGGVGSNISVLRPAKTQVLGVNGFSSGAVSWADYMSKLTHLIEQGGSRRGAQMIGLADWHPDIVSFAMCKIQNPLILDKISRETKNLLIKNTAEYYLLRDASGKPVGVRDPEYMTGANISILMSHDFMKAVENNETWKLRFPDLQSMTSEERNEYDEEWEKIGDIRKWEAKGRKSKIHHEIEAADLWHFFNVCARYSAEPGIIFIDECNDMSNSYYYPDGEGTLVVTNPCGEQPLPKFSVCNLGALNLDTMYDEEEHDVNWSLLKKVTWIAQRFSDNVIDESFYFLSENERMAKNERRVGKGVMGLADLFIKLKTRYGSDKMLEITDKVFEMIAVESYLASADLAQEKGSFPYFDAEKLLESGYMKRMPEHVRQAIREKGLRNVCSITVAPTGSTGTMIGVSTGLEPYYGFTYYRSGRLGQFVEVKTAISQRYFDQHPEADKLPDYYVSATELSPLEHVKVQGAIQRWTDSAISKTCNAPKDFTVEDNKELYMEAWKAGCKGVTVYVDGSRDSQVLNLTTEEDSIQDETNRKKAIEQTSFNIENAVKVIEKDEDGELMAPTNACTLTWDDQGNMIKECH